MIETSRTRQAKAASDVHAPYNFIEFTTKVLSSQGDLPSHHVLDPELKTGEIHVTMTAKTPVFVSDGQKGKGVEPHFFRSPDGKFALPGSSIRGMTRANMQILGYGLILPGEDFEDQRLYFRNIAAARASTGKGLKEYYHNALKVKTDRGFEGNMYSIPKAVEAGYLHKSGSGYEIQPVEHYYRVSKAVLKEAGEGLEDLHATAIPVDYMIIGEEVSSIRRASGNIDELPQGAKRGILLCPGVDSQGDGTYQTRNGKQKPPSHRYVFSEIDQKKAPVKIEKEDELSYMADWEDRRNNLKGGSTVNREKVEYDPDFWKLPQNTGEEKPVFYVRYNGHTYFSMTLFPRIGYERPLGEGLPESHRKIAQEAEENGIYPRDYLRDILGYAGKNEAYRSRVFFRDFAVVGNPQEQNLIVTVLGGPKPSWYPGYTVDGKNYNQDDFQLRGQKRYWMKERVHPVETDKVGVAVHLRPLPAGTQFRGVIHYRNLREHELGLLLWALRLEDGCYQSIGMGKPFGFGRMTLKIDRLLEYDFNTLYQSLCAGPKLSEDVAKAVDDYIQCYDEFAVRALQIRQPRGHPSVRSRREILDFFYLCRTVWSPAKPDESDEKTDGISYGEVDYMGLKDYQNNTEILPTLAEFRKEAEKEAGPIVEQEAEPVEQENPETSSISMEELKLQLQRRLGNAVSGVSNQTVPKGKKKKRRK